MMEAMATEFVKVTLETADAERLRRQAHKERCSVAHILRRGVGAVDPQLGGLRATGRRPGRPRKVQVEPKA